MATCSCGACEYSSNYNAGLWHWPDVTNAVRYCPACGDKLNLDGTVEIRAELERDRKRLDVLSECGLWQDPDTGEFSASSWYPAQRHPETQLRALADAVEEAQDTQ